MIKIIKRFIHTFEKLTPEEQFKNGKFRVKYIDGGITTPLDYSSAKHLARLYGGEIIDNF